MADNTSQGSIRHLDTSKMENAMKAFGDGAKEYAEITYLFSKQTTTLFEHWDGHGRNQFEKDYNIICQKLSDIQDILYELRDALIDSESVYIEVDQQISKNNTK